MSTNSGATPASSPRRTAPVRWPAPGSGPHPRRVRIPQLQEMKLRGERWAMLTAYEQYAAEIFDEAGIPVLLVGDSAGNNVFGYETTMPVTRRRDGHADRRRCPAACGMRSSSATCRSAPTRPVPQQALETCDPVHEGGRRPRGQARGRQTPLCRRSRRWSTAGIPVMAHIGFTPQSEHTLGGYRVQGRGDAADRLVEDACALEEAGAFAIVHGDGAGRRGRAGHRGARDPDDRHRRRAALRRPGAGLAGHGRPARRQDGRASSSSTPTCAAP